MGYVDLFFKHVIYFQIQDLYDVIMTPQRCHNEKHERPCNFAIFKIKSTNLVSWGILMQIFAKNYMIPNSKLL